MFSGRRHPVPLVFLLLAATISVAGVAAWWGLGARAGSAVQSEIAYTCPMHPQYRSNHPGDCPSCGMRLEPVGAETSSTSRALPAGAVQVSAERQQAIGVRLGVAERVSGTRTLRTTGRVAANENATYPIIAGVSGWVRSVREVTTGSRVRKDEILASFYAPEFVVAQQSYYAGLETTDRTSSQQLQTYSQQRVFDGLQRFADQLRNLGVSETQLAEMSKKRQMVQDIHVMSPIDGFVLQRNITNGLRFDRGFEMYRIADLRRVLILADVYQHQMRFITPGMTVRLTAPQVDRAFAATVSRSEPIFDQESLTMQVRIEADNPQSILKPGMFVDVELTVDIGEALVVPADAISDSGLRKTVFVDLGGGYFEPRQVETGWRIGDFVEVTKGLMPGERIVMSGTFLVDSESRMKAAARGILGEAAEDPVCGMLVDQKRAAAAGHVSDHGGKKYYFCADSCRQTFGKDPARYLERGAAPATAQPATQAEARDPICGMTVNEQDARKAGLVSERAGQTQYFCSAQCKTEFDRAAGKR